MFRVPDSTSGLKHELRHRNKAAKRSGARAHATKERSASPDRGNDTLRVVAGMQGGCTRAAHKTDLGISHLSNRIFEVFFSTMGRSICIQWSRVRLGRGRSMHSSIPLLAFASYLPIIFNWLFKIAYSFIESPSKRFRNTFELFKKFVKRGDSTNRSLINKRTHPTSKDFYALIDCFRPSSYKPTLDHVLGRITVSRGHDPFKLLEPAADLVLPLPISSFESVPRPFLDGSIAVLSVTQTLDLSLKSFRLILT